MAQWKFRKTESAATIHNIAEEIVPYDSTMTYLTDVQNFFKSQFLHGFIGIIFLFDTRVKPLHFQSIQEHFMKQGHVLIILTPNTAPDLFTEAEWEYLKKVKDFSNNRKRKQNETENQDSKKSKK